MPISMYFPSGPQFALKPQVVLNPEHTLPTEELDTEFKRQYPPDAFGHEGDDTARVWKVYRTHAIAHDDSLLEGWNATLDILLIFAGLFSAVVTTFLVESYQTLQFDSDAFIVTALYKLVAATVPANSLADVDLPRPPAFLNSPPQASRLVNGLWFTSLLLALSVALLSILVKQWLHGYKSRTNAPIQSPRHWSLRRTFLLRALKDWPVGGLISVLPVLLHFALFLFLMGAVVFLWDLNSGIAILFAIVTGALGAFYIACIRVALWRPECPTSAPVVNIIRSTYISVRIALVRVRTGIRLRVVLLRLAFRFQSSLLIRGAATVRALVCGFGRSYAHRESQVVVPGDEEHTAAMPELITNSALHSDPAKDQIGRLRRRMNDVVMIQEYCRLQDSNLAVATLKWLITNVSDSDAVAVGLQALGALPPAAATLLHDDIDIKELAASGAYFTRARTLPGQTEIARVVRAMYAMNNVHSVSGVLRCTRPDCAIASHCTHTQTQSAHFDRGLMGTIFIALRGPSSRSMISCLRFCLLEDRAMDWDGVLRFLDKTFGRDQAGLPSRLPMDLYVALYALRCVTGLLPPLLKSPHGTPGVLHPQIALGENENALHQTALHLLKFVLPRLRFDRRQKLRGAYYLIHPELIQGLLQEELDHVLEVLSSSSFLEYSHTRITVENAMLFLECVFKSSLQLKRYNVAHPAAHTWASILHKFGNKARLMSRVYTVLWDALDEEMPESDRAEVLALVLLPPFSQVSTTAWQFVSSSTFVAAAYRIRIATRLSIELRCLDSSDPRYATLLNHFFDHLHLSDLLRAASGLQSCYEFAVALSRHCRSHRPSLWDHIVKEAEVDGDDGFGALLGTMLQEMESEDVDPISWEDVVDAPPITGRQSQNSSDAEDYSPFTRLRRDENEVHWI